jgi:hypothetical protein
MGKPCDCSENDPIGGSLRNDDAAGPHVCRWPRVAIALAVPLLTATMFAYAGAVSINVRARLHGAHFRSIAMTASRECSKNRVRRSLPPALRV